jgi:hypothetical protein
LGLYTVLLIVAPSLSFLIYGVQNSLSLKRNIKSKNNTLKLIDKVLEDYSEDNTMPKKITLRQIQDLIFTERSVPVKIPDWFYTLFKSSNDERTDSIIKSIKAEL